MQIYLNDSPIELEKSLNLEQLIVQQQLNPQGLAIALNQQILPRSQWAKTMLQTNDRLTVFRAIAGG